MQPGHILSSPRQAATFHGGALASILTVVLTICGSVVLYLFGQVSRRVARFAEPAR